MSDGSEELPKVVGKTIQSIEPISTMGMSDQCNIQFTDGTKLVINASWCNDRTAELDYTVKNMT